MTALASPADPLVHDAAPRRAMGFLLASLMIHAGLAAWLLRPAPGLLPPAAPPPLRVRIQPAPAETPATEPKQAPTPPAPAPATNTPATAKPRPQSPPRIASPQPVPSRPVPSRAAPAGPTTVAPAARPGLLVTSLDAAQAAGERLAADTMARESHAPCQPGSEMTARCAKGGSFAQARRHELEYQGDMPNLVAAADAAEAGRVKSCSAQGGGLLSLGCLINAPHLLNKGVNKLIRKARRR